MGLHHEQRYEGANEASPLKMQAQLHKQLSKLACVLCFCQALLEGFGTSVEKECERGNEAIAAALALAGVNVSRLGPTKQQASRALRNKIKDGVAKLLHHATERQREINRMMTPNIKEKMIPGYAAGVNVERGQGRFGRMKCAVMAHVSREFSTMFAQVPRLMLCLFVCGIKL